MANLCGKSMPKMWETVMFKLSPEIEEQLARSRELEGTYKSAFASMTDANLVASAKFWMAHSEAPRRFAPDEPIYDATLWHVIVPELLRRVENGHDRSNARDSRASRTEGL